jgi:hypothetical protein
MNGSAPRRKQALRTLRIADRIPLFVMSEYFAVYEGLMTL